MLQETTHYPLTVPGKILVFSGCQKKSNRRFPPKFCFSTFARSTHFSDADMPKPNLVVWPQNHVQRAEKPLPAIFVAFFFGFHLLQTYHHIINLQQRSFDLLGSGCNKKHQMNLQHVKWLTFLCHCIPNPKPCRNSVKITMKSYP